MPKRRRRKVPKRRRRRKVMKRPQPQAPAINLYGRAPAARYCQVDGAAAPLFALPVSSYAKDLI